MESKALPVRIKDKYRSILFQVIVVLLTSACNNTNSADRDPPNVVLILIDDLGWKDLGVYGSRFYETPNIDKLAAEGMRFTNAYSACPVCSPSRASILTGKNPAHLKFTGHITSIGKHRYPEDGKIIPPADRMYVDPDETMIPEILKDRGYKTASIGKWHVGDSDEYFPLQQGFDINVAGYEHGSPPTYWGPYEKDQDWNPVIKNLDRRLAGEYLTDRLTDEAISFVEKNKNQPFFLYLAHYAVHTPLEAPDSLVKKYEEKLTHFSEQKDAVYGAMIENMDWNVGRLLDFLEKANLDNNTIVIFCSDNGGEGKVTNNFPLKNGKGFLYEGGIRIPLIVKWPGVTEAGSFSDEPVITDDLLPTIADMTGADTPTDIDGRSLTDVLRSNGKTARDMLAWYYPHYSPQAKTPGYAIRMGDFKLIEHYDPERIELFNISQDIGEQNDLSIAMPEKVREMKKAFQNWIMRLNPILHTENPNYKKRR